MSLIKYAVVLCLILFGEAASAQQTGGNMTREQRADQTYKQLFAAERTPDPTDPELLEILQRFIFGEVFYVGEADPKMRELITVVSLTTLQTLPQLKAHINAALNVGNTPSEIRESIYGSAPFIGFPRTLNAVGVFNQVMRERGIELPLENAAAVNEENRLEKGAAIQTALYGDEVKTAMETLPDQYKDKVPEILTGFCFGDFYTRKGLTLQQRELLALVTLTALGAEKQLPAHIMGNLKAGNDKQTLLAAMVQTIPYIGLPNALTAINLIKETEVENYQPIYRK